MDVWMLGSLEARGEDGPIDLGTAKVRRLFAALVLAAPHPVTGDALAETLWGDSLPADPAASLHSYMSRLRRALGRDRHRVVTARGTYSLELAPEELDGHRMEALVARAVVEFGDGDVSEAAVTLREATGLFRGEPLVEFAAEPFAQVTAERWAELRVTALERRVGADVALGRHEVVLGELESFVRVYPYREGLWRHLMVSLHQTGRRSDVERAAREMRELFQRELGVEPSTETQELVAKLTGHEVEPVGIPSESETRSIQRDRSLLPAIMASAAKGPFVGRRASLQALEADLTQATLVIGEPGIGKTRLVAELCHRAQQRGVEVLAGSCTEHGELAYEPFGRALESHLDRSMSVEEGPIDMDTFIQLGRVVPGLADKAGVSAPPFVESSGVLPLVAGAVRNVLEAAARDGGALLVVEDVHWADDATGHLIAELATDRPSGVGMVLTSRRLEPSSQHTVSRLLAERRLLGIRLKRLGESAIAALIAESSNGQVSASDASSLHRASGGNPFFALELLRSARAGDEAAAGVVATEGIRTLALQRVGRLSPEAQRVLQIVAVAGGEVALDVLERCAGDGADSMDEAVLADLLTERNDGSLGFTHLILCDALLESVGPWARRRTHRALADAMLSDRGKLSERQLLEAARHLSDGGAAADTTRAADALEEAADLAAGRGAFGDAAQQLRAAIGVLGDPAGETEQAAFLHVRLGWTLRRSGERTEALELGRQALSMAGTDRNAQIFADATLLQTPLRPDAAKAPALRSALARLGDEDDPRRARLLVELGWSLVEVEPTEADRYVSQGANLAESCGSYEATARAMDFDWEQHALTSSPEQRLEQGWHLARQAANAGERVAATHGHLHRAIAHIEMGQRSQLQAELERVVHLAGEIRAPVLLARAAQLRAMWAHLNGDLDAAEEAANEVLRHVPGDPSFLPIYAGQIVAIRKATGQLEGVAELIASDEANRNHPLALAAQAMVQAVCGRDEIAQTLLDEVLALGLDRLPKDMSWLATVAGLAETAALLNDRRAADLLWPALLPHAERVVIFGYGAVCWGVVDRFLAGLALVRGDALDAKQRISRSVSRHRELGAVPFVASDLLNLAEIVLADDPEAAQGLFREAHALASRHGLHAVEWDADDRLGSL